MDARVKRSRKAGLPPGSVVHTGEGKTGRAKITIMDYDEKEFQEKEGASVEECFSFRDTATTTWINVDGVHDTEMIRELGEHFGVHPLLVEDIASIDQRPKAEDFGKYLFVVLKMLCPDGKSGIVRSEQVSLILGKNFVISFQESEEGDVFDPVRARIRQDKGMIRKSGPDYLLYSLMDAIVDNYFVVLEKAGERVEVFEEELTKNPTEKMLRDIHSLKREMIMLRKSVWPLREVVNSLIRSESRLIRKHTAAYLRDVYDHTIQVIDTVETYRDILAGMVDIYLSSISNRMNEVMKVLTVIATIFIPLTFITGLYGMNFEYMPELEHPLGYPLTLGLMALVALSMLLYFRSRKWI